MSKSSDQFGLCLDKSQEDILAKSWHSKDPEKLTAYKEDSKVCFPFHEKSESTLQVTYWSLCSSRNTDRNL